MDLNLNASKIYKRNALSDKRVVLNIGSSRSTKTYSIMQLFIVRMLEKPGLYTVCRKTLPSLKASAYRDFLEILEKNNIYNLNNHNRSELIYKLGESEIEFISVDQPQKIKGRKRLTLFINEANELTFDDFTQLSLRTTGQIFMDLNPSHSEFHWIETKIKTRDDVEVIHSTYKDNPFLNRETIKEIERLQTTDLNLWRIYGLGEIAKPTNQIITHHQLIDILPEGEFFRGLDFGFNNPTALVDIIMRDDDIYTKELLYERYLNNNDLIQRMNSMELDKSIPIYADAEDPARIDEIRKAGYNIIATSKGKGSVKKGLDDIRARGLYVTKDSVNLLKEIAVYVYRLDTDGNPTEEPVKYMDHLIDALRGAVYTNIHNKQYIGFA
jgi:phage terminase large subunit